jgi:hypothetical protein
MEGRKREGRGKRVGEAQAAGLSCTCVPPAARMAPGPSLLERRKEQDVAAGGSGRRVVTLPDGGTARASIELKEFAWGPGRTFAYLRYWTGGKTVAVYVGRVEAPSRPAALAKAWALARSRGLLDARSLTERPPRVRQGR